MNFLKIKIRKFEDLDGKSYLASEGNMNEPSAEWDEKMVWTKATTGVLAPYYISPGDGGMPIVSAEP